MTIKCPRCGEPEHPDQCTVPAHVIAAALSHDTERAAAICEQMAINMRGNAVNCESRSLRLELEMCAETADQCALSIRHGRLITSADCSIQKRIV